MALEPTVTTPKRRRTGPTSRQLAGSYRPRDRLSPVNMVDSVDRHVSRATETDEALERYLKLLRFARSTTLAVGILLIIGCILFGAGIAAAVALAGLPPWAAIGIGAGGAATAIITAILKARHHLKAGPAAATDPLTRRASSAHTKHTDDQRRTTDRRATCREQRSTTPRPPLQLIRTDNDDHRSTPATQVRRLIRQFTRYGDVILRCAVNLTVHQQL